jgi:hypothetical protein
VLCLAAMQPSVLSLAFFASAACGVGFVEAQPPNLTTLQVKYSATSAAEPVVYGLLIDLDIPDPTACAAAMSWVEGFVQAAMLKADAGAIALPEQRLSGNGCAPLYSRSIDTLALSTAIAVVQAARPAAHVRPVLIYVNNLALPLAYGVSSGLTALHGLVLSGGVHPLLWAVAPGQAIASANGIVQSSVVWTFSQDAQVATAVAALVASELPLQSSAGGGSGPLAIAPDKLARVQMLKLCTSDATLTSTTLPQDGRPYALGDPPIFTFTLPATVAVPLAAFTLPSGSVVVEGCTAFCNHFVLGNDQDLGVPWSSVSSCTAL